MKTYKLLVSIVVILFLATAFNGIVQINPVTVAVGQAQESSGSTSAAGTDDALSQDTVIGSEYQETDPYLAQTLDAKLKTLALQAQGKSAAEIAAIVQAPPPEWRGGLPATGMVKVPVFLVDFDDAPHAENQTAAAVSSMMFGSGKASAYPYDSLANYYSRSSYGQLNVEGTVFSWYRAQQHRTYYEAMGKAGELELIREIFNYHDDRGINFTPFDNDGNGELDSFFIKWTGSDSGWMGYWWAKTSTYPFDVFKVDGKTLGKYVWSWYSRIGQGSYTYAPGVDIHETGHLLGLPDYYDYDCSQGPDNGVGGLDMMDANWGDHNSFSKLLLGWITPVVKILTDGQSQTETLNPSGTSKDGIIIMPMTSLSSTEPYSEFFMAQYRKRSAGNDAGYPTDGLIIWHIDARLNSDGTNFAYDNSYTSHKLLRLMEADGLEEIEQAACRDGTNDVDAGDFYLVPNMLGPSTTPNSNRYGGTATGVYITPLSAPGTTMQVEFAIGKRPTTLTIAASDQTPTTNERFYLSGTLQSSTATLANQPVHLERRMYSGGAWTAWTNLGDGYTRTNSTGGIRLSQIVATADQYQYRWHFNGTALYQSAYSSRMSITGKYPATLTIAASTTTPTVSVPFTLSGTLNINSVAINNQAVHLERKSYSGVAWTAWANVAGSYTYTNSTGQMKLSQTVSTDRLYMYRWHYNGTTTYQSAYSPSVLLNPKGLATFTIATSTTTPALNVPFTVSGTLTSGTTALNNYAVHLERRQFTLGLLFWQDVTGTYTRTNSTGGIKLDQTISTLGTTQYRWHFNGSENYAAAYSAAVTETVKAPTTFTIAASTTTPTTNVPFSLSGTLKSGTTALRYQPVHLERRQLAFDAWGSFMDVAGSYQYTNSTGSTKLSQTVPTAGTYQYRWHFNGTSTRLWSKSPALTMIVKKPTYMTIKTSPIAPRLNVPFTINGTLKSGTTGLVGYSVHLERKVGIDAWKDVTGTTKPTGTGGAIPSVSQTMTTHNTYSFRWHFTGTTMYKSCYSPVKTFIV